MTDGVAINVTDVIAKHAAARPWAVAIIENNGVIHYRALDRLIWSAAWHLRRSGVAPGDVVGMALPHSAMHLVAVYAQGSTCLPCCRKTARGRSAFRRSC